MTILCVDDDSEDLELLRGAIEEIDSSINYLSAGTGQEALDLLERGLSPNLIFLDINMPGMNGITCLAKIRENKKLDEINVVLLSTSHYPLSIQKIKSLPADFYTKPGSYEDLKNILNLALSKVKVE